MPESTEQADLWPPPGRGRLEGLTRDELIKLVEDLRTVVTQQEQAIARQGAAIRALQARTGREPANPGQGGSSLFAVPASERPPGSSRRTRPAVTPVPGADYTIVFDGGAIGNPGRGYGSYQIVGTQGVVSEGRRDYGDGVTNNQAEYLTLIHALEDLADRLNTGARRTSIAVRGDSQLIVEQVSGRMKVKHPNLQPLHRRASELLRGFGHVDVAWHGRDASVRILGH